MKPNRNTDPLFIELEQQQLDYLAAVVQHQIDCGNIHRKRDTVSPDSKIVPPAGYSYSYVRGRLLETKWIDSPESKKRKRKVKYHKAVVGSAASSGIVDQSLDGHATDDRGDDSCDAGGDRCSAQSDVSELEEVHEDS